MAVTKQLESDSVLLVTSDRLDLAGHIVGWLPQPCSVLLIHTASSTVQELKGVSEKSVNDAIPPLHVPTVLALQQTDISQCVAIYSQCVAIYCALSARAMVEMARDGERSLHGAAALQPSHELGQ